MKRRSSRATGGNYLDVHRSMEACSERLAEIHPVLLGDEITPYNVGKAQGIQDDEKRLEFAHIGIDRSLAHEYPTEFADGSFASFLSINHLYAPDEQKWFRVLERDIERRWAALRRYLASNAEKVEKRMNEVKQAYLGDGGSEKT